MKRIASAAACLLLFVAVTGCHSAHHVNQWNDVHAAVAVMHGTEGNAKVKGIVRFAELEDGRVYVTANISGLTPNAMHAIHVHQFGDCTAANATSAGGHYNPQAHEHALPNETHHRHAGDLGNLAADAKGNATLNLTVENLTIAGLMNPVIGRAVIIHAGQDKGAAAQPTGDAGGRLACGVIGVANPDAK